MTHDEVSNCTLCGAPGAYPARSSLTFKRAGVTVKVDGVPARRCDTCAGDTFPGPLSLEIEDAAHGIIDAIERFVAEPAPAATT